MLTVFELSGQNKSYLGLARAVFLVFLTLGNLLGGVLGEKFNRCELLNFTNYARIPIVISLLIFSNVYWVIFADGMIAFFTGIYNPTRQAMVNDIVPQDDIPKANALFGSSFAILHMIGPFIGAFLYSHFKGITEVLSFDLLTYFIGIYLIGTITYKPPKKDNTIKTSISSDLIEGMKYMAQKKEVFAIISNTLIAGFCIGFLIPLLLPYFIEVLHMDERAYGIAFSLFGLGGVFGGILSEKITKKFSLGKVITFCIYMEPVCMLLWLLFPGFYNTLFIFLIWGLVVILRMTSQLNFISQKVETKYLTRVFSLVDLAFVFPNIASGIIVSIIGNQATTNQILTTVSIVFIILIFPRLLFKDMRLLYSASNDKVNRDTSVQDQLEQG
ncbi:transporter, major facilitator family protein [Bacteriovorax sp. DB6_IX]|nr:transporter, major facilitator family protein [Bacteriovorax sp. DB6_IX]